MRRINHSCGISRYAAGAALFGFALAGLVLVALVPDDEKRETAAIREEGDAITEVNILARETDITALIKFCTTHTTVKRGFVIFSNGTCVLIPEPAVDPVGTAKLALSKCAKPEARFLTEETTEGDLIVTFEGSVFHFVPKEELDPLDRWTLRNREGLLSKLELATVDPDWAPPAEARLGLLGRKRLLADAERLEVVRILRPDTAVAKAGL